MIVTFYHRFHNLSHEIHLSRDTKGMQHELLQHFVQVLSPNGDYGFTHNTLQVFLVKIRNTRRSPNHATAPLPFSYHEVLDALRLADIDHYRVTPGPHGSPSMQVHQPLVAAAQMHPLRSPHDHGTSSPTGRGQLRPPPS
jgi:hypothetical protein